MRIVMIVAVLAVALDCVLAEPPAASKPASQSASAPAYTAWPFDAREAARRQDETAKNLGIRKELTLDLGKKVTMKLVLIPAGTFMMGCPDGDTSIARLFAQPQHEVILSKPFYMGLYHVTVGQFAAFMDETGYKTDAQKEGWAMAWNGKEIYRVDGASWKKPGFDQTDEHPAVCVSHNDAVAFCDWLSKKTGKTVKLPTEAQWEYACRAGTATPYQWGEKPNDGEGWFNGSDQSFKRVWGVCIFPWDDGYAFTSPVGKFKPNAFGLFDMHGNAFQWCADLYDEHYYSHSPKIDPQGAATSPSYVLRGGAWKSADFDYRSDSRLPCTSKPSIAFTGFRVVCTDVDSK